MPAPFLRILRPWASAPLVTGSQLVINGVNQTSRIHNESSFTWNLTVGQRGSASIPLLIDPSDPYTVEMGATVEIYEINNTTNASTRVFAGYVEDRAINWLSNDGWYILTLSVVSLEGIYDSQPATANTYIGVSAQFIFTALVGDGNGFPFLSSAGIITGSGFAMADRTFDGSTSIAAGFAEMATAATGFLWYVDPLDLTVNFHAFFERTLDFTLLYGMVIRDSIHWKQSRADFRDKQIIQLVGGGTVVATNTAGADLGIGSRFQVSVARQGTSTVDATAQATAALALYSVLPAQWSFESDYAGWRVGFRLLVSLAKPVGAGALLDGYWLIQDIQASWIAGMENAAEPYGHFRYTVTLINSMAVVPYQQTLARLVQTTPPITEQPASWTGGGGGGGSASGVLARTLTITDTTVADDIAPHVPIYTPIQLTSPIGHVVGTGVRIIGVLRLAIASDLVVRINVLATGLSPVGATSWTITIPLATPIDTSVILDISPDPFYDLDILTADILGSDGSQDDNGVATFTVEYSVA